MCRLPFRSLTIGRVRLVLLIHQASKGEVLRAIGGRATDPRVRSPVADAADERVHLVVDADDPLRFADLGGPALRTGFRSLHDCSVGPVRPEPRNCNGE
jgi:hypothetical protein